MFQEIKYRLFTIFLTQKKKLVFFTCLIFFGLFVVPQITHAFVLDLANVQLDALDFIDNTILKWIVFLALLAIESITLLIVSANLLDWSSALPVGLDNGIVNAGWHFTSGLANLAFILIFIVIALSYILRLETYGMKKALPRLIIIALLVNFSLLFVKMVSDIGWIAQGSFRSVFFEGGGFAMAAIESLKASSFNLIGVIVGIPVAYMLIALVPYLNVAALITIAGLVLATGGGALTGVISQTVLVILFNFILGLIFLIFAALFLIRIAVIWLLAIIAPLAFMAYILPNTQKYFNDWLKALIQWTLLGIVVFFLAGLGIKLFGLTMLDEGQGITFEEGQILGSWKFFSTFYKYIFLMVYLVVVLGVCKKLVPIGAQAIWGLGEKAVIGGGKLAGKGERRLGLRTQLGIQGSMTEAARRLEEKRAKGALPTRGEKMAGWMVKRTGGLALQEAQVAQTRSRLIEEQRKVLMAKTKDLDEDGAKASLRAELEKQKQKTNTLRDKSKTAALYKLLADKKALNDGDKGAFYEEAWKTAGPEEVKNNPVKKAVLASYPQFGTPAERKAQIDKSTPADIEKWDRSSKEDDEVIRDVVGTGRADLMAKIGSQTKVSSEKVQAEIGKTIGMAWEGLIKGVKIDPDYMQKLGDDKKKELLKNLNVIRYLHLSPLGEVQTWKKYGTLQKGASDNVEGLVEKLRKLIK